MRKSRVTYDPAKIDIELIPLKGARIDHVHGKEYRVKPRLYSVADGNLKTRGTWVTQLHDKKVRAKDGTIHEVTVVSVFLAPANSSKRMIAFTRQSIMVQIATVGRYRGLPYAHVTFRDPQQFGGKKTAGRGQRGELPAWFKKRYGRRMRLRKTVQGAVESDSEVGQRLGAFHDIKQVVVFPAWDDQEFIRYFFMMRVFSVENGYEFSE